MVVAMKDDRDYDEGIAFFAGFIVALPYILAFWIGAWCVFSKVGCLL